MQLRRPYAEKGRSDDGRSGNHQSAKTVREKSVSLQEVRRTESYKGRKTSSVREKV